MKQLFLTILLGLLTLTIFAQEVKVTDSLKSINIGKQIWSTENISIDISNSWDYLNEPSNSLIYGRLYTFDAAQKIEKMFPGWRLPSKEDFKILEKNLKNEYPENEIRDLVIYGGQSGLDLTLSGIYDAEGIDELLGKTNFYELGKDGHYWLSDGMYACLNNKEFIDISSGGDGASIRLIKNKE